MPTKKRHPKNSALAEQVKGRLEILRKPDGGPDDETTMTFSDFALKAGIPRSVYNAWRNSGRVPGGFYLRRVAESFKVTVDWLLCVPDAPKYRNQWRTDATLESDVAGYVAREVAAALTVSVSDVLVDGRGALQAAVSVSATRCREDATRLGHSWQRTREGAHLHNLLRGLVMRSVPDSSSSYDYGFVVRAATTGMERLQRITFGIGEASWSGPACLSGAALRHLLQGPEERSNPSADERRVGNPAAPERDGKIELHRRRVSARLSEAVAATRSEMPGPKLRADLKPAKRARR